ncbi:MAG: divalent-cation tolerance protein CutA [Candidatus Micrarchaeota archaeon]
MKIILAYITNPSKAAAEKLAAQLLKKKLIACANIFPISSIYRWKGKITTQREFVLLGKTTTAKFAALSKEVEKLHPYEVPCILKISADANESYGKWVTKETK